MIDGDAGDARQISLDIGQLAAVMPMFLQLDAGGMVRAIGPTLHKLFRGAPVIGESFFDLFEVSRPVQMQSVAALAAGSGRRLHLSLRNPPRTGLRGIAMPIGPGSGEGMLLNLSFGLAVAEAVREHGLTDGDFAPTDLTVEMLYLIEAKAAVMSELHGLNRRLGEAHRVALAQSMTDPLTGLANRRALKMALQAEAHAASDLISRASAAVAGTAEAREGRQALALAASRGGETVAPFAVAHLDLDFFKAVNDTLGHAAGDAVLAQVGRILREETRRDDLVARVGGDEFVLVLRGALAPAEIRALCARIIARLELPMPIAGQEIRISGSIGVVLSRDYPAGTAPRMLADADRALYISKAEGRARVTLLGES